MGVEDGAVEVVTVVGDVAEAAVLPDDGDACGKARLQKSKAVCAASSWQGLHTSLSQVSAGHLSEAHKGHLLASSLKRVGFPHAVFARQTHPGMKLHSLSASQATPVSWRELSDERLRLTEANADTGHDLVRAPATACRESIIAASAVTHEPGKCSMVTSAAGDGRREPLGRDSQIGGGVGASGAEGGRLVATEQLSLAKKVELWMCK